MLAEARGADAAAQRRMDNISRIRSEGAAAPEAQEDTAAAPPAAQPPPAPAHSPAAFRRRGYFEGRAPHTAPPPQAPPQPPAAPPPQPPQAPMSEFSFRTDERAPGRVSPAATSRNASGELPPAPSEGPAAAASISSTSRQEELAEALAAQGMPEMRAQQQANLESHIARQREEWARNYQANVDAYLAQQQQEHAAAYAFAPQAPSVSMSEVSGAVPAPVPPSQASSSRGTGAGAQRSDPGYNNIHNVWSSASSSPRGSVSGAVPAASRRSRSRSPPVSDAQVEAVFGPAPAPLNGLPLASAMARQVFGGEAVAAAEGLPLASAAAREVFGQRRRRRPASWRSHTSSVVETGGARNEVLLPGMEAVFGPVEPILDDMRRARTTGQAALDRLNAAIARGAVPAYGGGAGGAVPP